MTTEATPVPMPQESSTPAPSRAATSGDLWHTVLRVAWLSIGLGIVLEILLLVLAAYTNTGGASPKPFIADLAHKVSWSFIVCVGLAFGTTAGKARSGIMGLLGLVSAPAAFSVARSVHKGVNQAMGVAAVAGGLSPFVLAALKAGEYAVLGAILGVLTRRVKGAGLGAHLGAGAAVGLTFGVAIVALLARAAAKPMGPVDLVAKGINEVLFPVGCSLVLFAAEVMGRRLRG